MKKIKKLLAMVMAMAMVLGMSVTAFADYNVDSDPHITVSGLPEGSETHKTTIKYKQIAEAAPTDPIGWSLVQGVTLSNGVTINDLVNLNGDNANAAAGTIGHETVVKAIQNIDLSTAPSVETTATTETIFGVNPGLYVIQVEAEGYTFARMLAYVAFNESRNGAILNTPVTAKGEEDKVSKSSTDGSVAVGDVVPYTVEIQYPYLDGTWNSAQNKMTYPEFSILDTVTGGKIVRNDKVNGNIALSDVVIKIGDKVVGGTGEGNLSANLVKTIENVTPTEGATDSFKITFDYNPTYASQKVTITYNVEVTEAMTESGLKNAVTAKIGDKTPGAEVINPTVKLIVTKREANIVDGNETNTGKVLADAHFKLYVVVENAADATHVVSTKTLAENKSINVIVPKPSELADGTTYTFLKEVEYTTEYNSATEVEKDGNGNYIGRKTSADGTVTFDKLDAQKTYWVVESKAPNGYSLNEEAKQLVNTSYQAGTPTKNNEGVWVTTNTASDFNGVTITDTQLNSLPSTGGIGTTIFTIGGCAIMIIAAGLFFATRRKSAK